MQYRAIYPGPSVTKTVLPGVAPTLITYSFEGLERGWNRAFLVLRTRRHFIDGSPLNRLKADAPITSRRRLQAG
jgi:hypothetical protein